MSLSISFSLCEKKNKHRLIDRFLPISVLFIHKRYMATITRIYIYLYVCVCVYTYYILVCILCVVRFVIRADHALVCECACAVRFSRTRFQERGDYKTAFRQIVKKKKNTMVSTDSQGTYILFASK